MKSLRFLSNVFLWFGLILAPVLVGLAPSVQAQEIRLSERPIFDLLTHLEHLQDAPGKSDEPIVLDFVVVNDSSDQVHWQFFTEVLEPIAFSFVIEGQAEPIFQSPFSSRVQKSHASQGPILTSELIVMSPGEQLQVRAEFEKLPSPTLFPISLRSRSDVETRNQRRSLSHGIFFGAILTFVLLFLLSPNFLLNAASNWFGMYLVSMAMLNMHSHGYTMTYLQVTPEAHFLLTRLLHTCVMFFYLQFVLSFLKASTDFPVYWRSVWVFIFVGMTIAGLEQLLQSAAFQIIADLVPLTFVLLGFWGAYLAVSNRLNGSSFFMTGYAVLVIGGWINFMASLPQFAQWNEIIDQLTLFFQTTDALIFGGAILGQVYGLRQARDEAVAAKLAETERRLALSTKLLETEGDLHRTRNLAESHRANLASTSHDLRQPIVSLRMSLEVAKDRSPQLVSELSAGIQFLDQLLEQTLVSTATEFPSHENAAALDQQETVELRIILQNAQRMFALEATQKGIALQVVDSSVAVRVPTIDLIRMVSNLISNAVRYTMTGTVLVGVRRRNGYAVIEVWDTGLGIPKEQLQSILHPYFRGASSETTDGNGLGLSIVRDLADKNGLTLKVCSEQGKGSVFSIEGLVVK